MDAIEDGETTFLKADEVDDAGLNPDEAPLPPPGMDPDDAAAERGDDNPQSPSYFYRDRDDDFAASRPSLRKDKWPSAPEQPPPLAPPPPAPDSENPTDSLSLMQLKKLVSEMPKMEPTPYTFAYEDYASFEEELEELFGYSTEERASLLKSQNSFSELWEECNDFGRGAHGSGPYREGLINWRDSSFESQRGFLAKIGASLSGDGPISRLASLECLVYLALGCWVETAGLDGSGNAGIPADHASSEEASNRNQKYSKFSVQVSCIKDNLRMINEEIAVQTLHDIMQMVCLHEIVPSTTDRANGENGVNGNADEGPEEQWASLTLLSIFVNFASREDLDNEEPMLRSTMMKLKPNLLHTLTDLLAELRWDDTNNVPPAKLLSLYWKTILLTFGGTSKVVEIRSALINGAEDSNEDNEAPRITASPLDYHMFRQEITSKYPAFNPPAPLFPFEPESNSILPPLQDFAVREGLSSKPYGFDHAQTGTSILHQPVHIATPAPSPPPSPAGPGGKGIKKQNYQTNQMLPFLYPPLGESSNDLGGKGSTELQDLLVGRKWLGSDIPASILEAADLFSKRTRATRAMKQLWEERVKFVKYERGYGTLDEKTPGAEAEKEDDEAEIHDAVAGDGVELKDDLKERLRAVENFYKYALPHLQSVIIVLLKVLLQTVTTLVTQPNFLNGFQSGAGSQDQGHLAYVNADNNENLEADGAKSNDSTLSDLDTMRSQEIMGKAVSGTLFLLLKWFKLSHILKFEYMTQLLLDSNYVQLILKLFTHQELERVVNFKCEKESLNFFSFCMSQSRHGAEAGTDISSNEDDAVPPPIKLSRQPQESPSPEAAAAAAPTVALDGQPPSQAIPEVDELGYPTANLPAAPITEFSWRAFYSNINHLRILQKIVKAKPHRQLLMVQYKYSNILKKSLKVPQPDIRLYTLKIIKGQVPFCHRKWRQSNMRIITAIYLHCRPSLRDEWLAGIDVDQEMGDALPMEQALRALTYWYNLRRYPVEMGVTDGKGLARGDRSKAEKEARQKFEEEEQDFFVRELEKMDFAVEQGQAEAEAEGHAEQGEELMQHGTEAQNWQGAMEGW